MAFLCPEGFKKRGKSGGTSIANAYGVTDLSEDGGLPDQMGKLSLHAKPDLLEVVEDYTQCSVLELPVQQGEIVTFLGSEGAWVFVRTTNGADGYIPRRSCRIIRNRSETSTHAHQHDLSDVGYYSDHQHNEGDNRGSERSSKKLNRHSDFLKRSLSLQEAYDIEKYRTDSETSSTNGSSFSNRDHRYTSFDAIRYPQCSVSDCMENAPWIYQPKERMYHSVPPSPAVCGRKCGERCIHKTNSDSVQSVGYPSDIQLKGGKYPSDIHLEREQYTSDIHIKREEYVHNDVRAYSSETDNERGGNARSVDKSKRSSLSVDTRTNIIEEIEDKKRMERRLQVNKKVVSHVRSTLDEHRRVQKSATSYWKETDTKMRKGKSKKKANKCISAPEGMLLSICGHPELIVIKDYEKAGGTDISVSCGDFATIINDTKYTDWIFIQNENGERGFIPKDCTLKHQCKDCDNTDKVIEEKLKYSRLIGGGDLVNSKPNYDEMKQMIVYESFSGDNPDDLKVVIGDTVYLHKDVQSIQDWLWVYSPRQKCFGYVPVNAVKDASEVEKISV